MRNGFWPVELWYWETSCGAHEFSVLARRGVVRPAGGNEPTRTTARYRCIIYNIYYRYMATYRLCLFAGILCTSGSEPEGVWVILSRPAWRPTELNNNNISFCHPCSAHILYIIVCILKCIRETTFCRFREHVYC